jgi:PAS domain S-box-containing protein
MKNIKTLVIVVLLVVVLSQPFLTSIFIAQEWVNLIATLGYILILYPLFLIYKVLAETKEESQSFEVESEANLLKDELKNVYNGTKNDFLFFVHERDQAFSKVSQSVNDILEVNPEEFRNNYKRHKAEPLWDGAFERARSFAEKGIRVPTYEIELISKSGKPILMEVNEMPIFDEDNELVRIWVTVHSLDKHNLGIESLSINNSEKYDLLYNNLNDGVFLMRGDRFVDCNSKILDIFRTTLEQILMYSPFSNKFSPTNQPSGKNSKEGALYRMRLAYEGERQVFEWTHLRNTGESFKAQITLIRFEFNKEPYLYAIVKDLSQIVKLEAELEKREEFIDLLFEQSPIGIIKHDKNSKLLTTNRAFREIYKVSTDISQYTLANLFKNKDLTEAVEKSRTDGVQSLTLNLYKYNSNEKFVAIIKIVPTSALEEYNGGLVLLEELSDTSELKKALNTKQNNLEEIISNSKDVLYKYDLINGQYDYVSKSIQDIFGYTSLEFRSLTESQLRSLLHPKELARADQIIAKMIKSDEIIPQTIECSIIDRRGNVKWIEDTYTFVPDENGKAKAIIGYIRDLTHLKENKRLLLEKEKQIELLSENKNIGIAIVVNNKFQLVNSEVSKMTGYSKEELISLDYLFALAPEKEKFEIKKAYIKMISSNSSQNELCFWIKTKQGSHIYIKNEYFFEDETYKNYRVQSRDITSERIQAYKDHPSDELKAELETYLETF